MARRKPAEQGEEPVNPSEQQAPQAEGQAAGAGEAPDAAPARKSAWLARFPTWTDAEAGVHLIEPLLDWTVQQAGFDCLIQ